MNRLSCCVLDCHRTPYEKASFGDLLLNSLKLGETNLITPVFLKLILSAFEHIKTSESMGTLSTKK